MPKSKSETLSSFRTRSGLLKDKHFAEYDKKRSVIVEECGDDWKLKTRRIAELLFAPDGDFQKFLWDNLSEQEKILQERKARGNQRKNKSTITYS